MWRVIAINAARNVTNPRTTSGTTCLQSSMVLRSMVTVTKTFAGGRIDNETDGGSKKDSTPGSPPFDPSSFVFGDRKEIQLPNFEREQVLLELQKDIRLHYQHGNYKDALQSSQDLLKEALDLYGKEHPATASAYNNIGLMYKSTGEWALARENYHEALRIYGRVIGKDHASYAGALHNIGALNKMQVHVDESLSTWERMQFHEEALEYLQDAWRIRQVELGDEHPHTVASRSYFGSTLAAQVLQSSKRASGSSSFQMTKFTRQRWQAAEEHLRAAFKTSVENPRGSRVEVDNEEQESYENQSHGSIKTLSAAAAAQNLAVFLKSRGTRVINEEEGTFQVVDDDALAEAKQLYEEVLKIRTKLLIRTHPDLVATKFSLAELLEILGDESGAAALREDIIESYDVEEREGDPDDVVMGERDDKGEKK